MFKVVKGQVTTKLFCSFPTCGGRLVEPAKQDPHIAQVGLRPVCCLLSGFNSVVCLPFFVTFQWPLQLSSMFPVLVP